MLRLGSLTIFHLRAQDHAQHVLALRGIIVSPSTLIIVGASFRAFLTLTAALAAFFDVTSGLARIRQ
jgi:hypothetical protein